MRVEGADDARLLLLQARRRAKACGSGTAGTHMFVRMVVCDNRHARMSVLHAISIAGAFDKLARDVPLRACCFFVFRSVCNSQCVSHRLS